MKRLLLFLLLLALGIGALRLAIGDEPAPAPVPRSDGPGVRQPRDQGVPLQHGGRSAAVTVSGPLQLTRWRDVRLADGSIRKDEVFVLQAADSRPVEQGLQQLDRTDVELFDDGRPMATITATQAFVQLRPDANGKLSIDEGKDVDARDVVVVGEPGSRLEGLRLELGNARIRIEDDEVHLTTPRDQPVAATLAGDSPITLRGRGAQALLPRSRGAALRRADVEILQDPVLVADGVDVRARGRLLYSEELDTGDVRLTLDDEVVFAAQRADAALAGFGGRRAEGGRAAAPAWAQGDQFLGWLHRARAGTGQHGGARARISWQQMLLTGSPAVVELAGLRVRTPRLGVQPGALGDPFLVTAHGGESIVEQLELRPGSRLDDVLVGRAARRLHVVRTADHVGALHRAYGFPRWSMRPFEELQLVIGEGPVHLSSGARSLATSSGVRLWRRDGVDGGILRGLGEASVRLPATAKSAELLANGNDGFTLVVDPTAERLRLGPSGGEPAAHHRYEVRYAGAVLRGSGACDLERAAPHTRIHLLAPTATTTLEWPRHGLELRGAHELRAELLGEELAALDAAGWPLDLAIVRAGEQATAKAPRLLQTGPQSLRLLPADPAVPQRWSGLPPTEREPLLRHVVAARGHRAAHRLEVRGPCIDVHHVGGSNVLVDATQVGDELPRVHAHVGSSGDAADTTIACAARRLRVLPFLVAPEAQGWLHRDVGAAMAWLGFRSFGQPWLLVDDPVDFALEDPRHGRVEGIGRTLLVSQGGQAALFVGDAASLQPAEVRRTRDGRTVTLRGARVRAFDDKGSRLQALGTFADRDEFLPPTLTLRSPQRTGLLSNMRATCQGDIDVLPDAIIYGGPVRAVSIGADDAPDARGLDIAAKQLHMRRLIDNGEIALVTGAGVDVQWADVHARSADVELDLRRSRIVASDPEEAVVTLADGREVRSPRVEFDYRTMALRTSRGRVRQPGTAEVAR
jgi:hypothetical protein